MQRIFTCCGIQNIILTPNPNKELNILIYRTHSYVITRSHMTYIVLVGR